MPIASWSGGQTAPTVSSGAKIARWNTPVAKTMNRVLPIAHAAEQQQLKQQLTSNNFKNDVAAPKPVPQKTTISSLLFHNPVEHAVGGAVKAAPTVAKNVAMLPVNTAKTATAELTGNQKAQQNATTQANKVFHPVGALVKSNVQQVGQAAKNVAQAGVINPIKLASAAVTGNKQAEQNATKQIQKESIKKILGSAGTLATLAIPELKGAKEAAVAEKGVKAASGRATQAAIKGGAGLGAYGASAAAQQGASNKQIVESGLKSGVLGATIGSVGSLLKSGVSAAKGTSLPSSEETKPTMTPGITQSKVAGKGIVSKVKNAVSKPLSEEETVGQEGSVDPGAVVTDVKDMIAKHQAVNKATGDIAHDYAINQGTKYDINLDATAVLKNRTTLSNEDKQALQGYRDAKAAGLPTAELPGHLKEANDNINALNSSAQQADAEKARLTGNEAKAQAIEAQDPTTYTHREAVGKGSALEQTIRGDRDDPLSGGPLAKTTSGSNKRTFMNATDEEGSRRTVAIEKGRVTALEDGGNTKEDLGNLNLKNNQDFLDKELKPYQTKINNLQKEGDALLKVKTKGGVSDARITALAQKASLLEDPGNMTTLTTREARSLHDAKLKLRELTRVKEPGTNVSGRLKTINSHLIKMNNQINEISNKYDPETLDQKSFVGKDGKKYTLGQAMQDEITKSTGTKYYTDPELTTMLNYVASKRSLENTRFIENTKSILEDKQFAFKDGETAPKGFVKTDNPYFSGYKLDPKLAEQLDDMVGKKTSVVGKAFNKVGNFLKQTIVYLPIKHNFNEGAGYIIDRGLTRWLNPAAYIRMGKSLKAATQAVATHNEFYRNVLKSDFNMMGADDKALGKVVSKQLKTTLDRPEQVNKFAQSFGMSPVRAYKALQKVSVYDVQDILNLARINERTQGTLFSKGMSLENAIKDTAKTNFQYKVPSRVGLPGKTGRAAAEGLKSNKVYFGAYTYDKFRIAKNILKTATNITKPKEALEAADKLAATLAISAVLWPQVDKELQNVTGDKNAHITAPGVSSIAEKVQQVAQGKTSPTAAAGSQVSVAAPITIGAQLLGNTNSFTSKPIRDVNAPAGTQGKQLLSFLGGQLSPSEKLSTVKNSTTNKGLSTFLSLAGASLPKNSPQTNKLQSLKFDTLPDVQTNAKATAAKGDVRGAINIINNYNKSITKAVQAAAKADGTKVPTSAQLKSSGYYYDPSLSTVQSWQKTSTKPATLQSILKTKVAPAKGQPGYKAYERQQALKAKRTKFFNRENPKANAPVVSLP